jgi:hypothetical protein
LPLKDPKCRPRLLILNIDTLEEAKSRGENLSRIVREYLQERYFNKQDLEREMEDIKRSEQELEIRKKNIEIKMQESELQAQPEPQKPNSKIKNTLGSIILCPKCQAENVLTNRKVDTRTCLKCGFIIPKKDFKYREGDNIVGTP